MFEIKKNVPLPTSPRGPGRGPMYPFAKMGPGDSFAVPVPADSNSAKVADRMRGASSTWRKRNLSALSFSVRVFKDEAGAVFVGVWANAAPEKAKTA